MKFKEFIGIDVSKSHLDVFLHFQQLHAQFSNNESGFRKMIQWIGQQVDCNPGEIFFALEHTGLYSLNLSLFLDQQQYAYTLIGGLALKRSRGIVRGKSDKMDARAIAEYAFEKKHKLRLYHMPSQTVIKLKRLASYRERLVHDRSAYKARIHEYKAFLDPGSNVVLFDSQVRMIAQLNAEIKKIENEMYKLIKEDEKIAIQFNLIKSIKSVGPQTALMMIVLTHEFTLFEKWRKFASYAGTAPFPNESGTIKRKTRISHLANKRIKTLLNCCAVSAIQHNHEMRIYYQRRLAEGKNERSTINMIRNKLLARIFAVVERGTPYVNVLKYAA
jgi:transposase